MPPSAAKALYSLFLSVCFFVCFRVFFLLILFISTLSSSWYLASRWSNHSSDRICSSKNFKERVPWPDPFSISNSFLFSSNGVGIGPILVVFGEQDHRVHPYTNSHLDGGDRVQFMSSDRSRPLGGGTGEKFGLSPFLDGDQVESELSLHRLGHGPDRKVAENHRVELLNHLAPHDATQCAPLLP